MRKPSTRRKSRNEETSEAMSDLLKAYQTSFSEQNYDQISLE